MRPQQDTNAKVPRATYLGSPITLPMAPRPAHDLTKHMCQRAGPAGRVGGRPARLRGRSGPSCRHSRTEAVGGAARHGLPCRAAPPASSPPYAPRAGSAKEATSGVFAGPAWPDFASPAAASLGGIPARPPAAARAAGEAAGLDGSENSMDLNVPVPDSVATSRLAHTRRSCVGVAMTGPV